MKSRMRGFGPYRVLCLAFLASLGGAVCAQQTPSVVVAPSKMPKVGTVDPRFISYNVETVEVTGGQFWKPYKLGVAGQDPTEYPIGTNPGLYHYLPPVDLTNPRLRKLAAALGPAYVRVSGGWQNMTFFQNDDKPALAKAPKGFDGVLTRAQWKGVVEFSRAVDAKIFTSVAISSGTRDADGIWTPAQAKAEFDYTKSLGGSIAAVEFMTEPAFPVKAGLPAGYGAVEFGRDVKLFKTFLRQESPSTLFFGPDGIGEGVPPMPGSPKVVLPTEDLLKATGPVFDGFSYHFLATASHRCGGTLTVDRALTPEWLDRAGQAAAFYIALRNKYLPGKPIWLSETAEGSCGGDVFSGQYVDSFRFMSQLGTLAQMSVKAVFYNTLLSSDYGLINQDTFVPKPNYWAALLWHKTMGTVALDPGVPKDKSLRVYAQCMKNSVGGVTLLALNTDATEEQTFTVPQAGDRYTLTAADLTSAKVSLNGTELQTLPDGSIPAIKGQHVQAGTVRLAPLSITFLTIPSARNKSCME